jgi:hypothetical protein
MSSHRRITNELKRDWTELYQKTNSIYVHSNANNKVIFSFFFNSYRVLITFDFKNRSYPFKPPLIYVGHNNYEYISLLPTSWEFSSLVLGNKKCVCCESILCQRWGPHRTIIEITNEIKTNFQNKIRLMEIAHCRKFVDKQFGHYLPIEEFL